MFGNHTIEYMLLGKTDEELRRIISHVETNEGLFSIGLEEYGSVETFKRDAELNIRKIREAIYRTLDQDYTTGYGLRETIKITSEKEFNKIVKEHDLDSVSPFYICLIYLFPEIERLCSGFSSYARSVSDTISSDVCYVSLANDEAVVSLSGNNNISGLVFKNPINETNYKIRLETDQNTGVSVYTFSSTNSHISVDVWKETMTSYDRYVESKNRLTSDIINGYSASLTELSHTLKENILNSGNDSIKLEALKRTLMITKDITVSISNLATVHNVLVSKITTNESLDD